MKRMLGWALPPGVNKACVFFYRLGWHPFVTQLAVKRHRYYKTIVGSRYVIPSSIQFSSFTAWIEIIYQVEKLLGEFILAMKNNAAPCDVIKAEFFVVKKFDLPLFLLLYLKLIIFIPIKRRLQFAHWKFVKMLYSLLLTFTVAQAWRTLKNSPCVLNERPIMT